MNIFIGTDHAGFELKQKLVPFLESLGHDVVDMGANEYDAYDDYPDFVSIVAEEISKHSDSTKYRGIVLGGSGQGEAVVANRFKNVRACVFYGPNANMNVVKVSREHNDSNILALGARFMTEEEAFKAVQDWLEAPFSGDERHVRRISKIDK